ncbi:unnamed protein product [Ilex paraguariensis]|uniref:Protein kinase domain-containing protein n=1 Tax=Ilex paraguariensis TaxID=185542 RepID=A0ABC8T920_9AQUA
MELRDVLCTETLSPQTSFSLLRKIPSEEGFYVGIAEAVGYLHNGTERCVVHRDIKPSNILLSSKKNPK